VRLDADHRAGAGIFERLQLVKDADLGPEPCSTSITTKSTRLASTIGRQR
jgi:hypothetical protein